MIKFLCIEAKNDRKVHACFVKFSQHIIKVDQYHLYFRRNKYRKGQNQHSNLILPELSKVRCKTVVIKFRM